MTIFRELSDKHRKILAEISYEGQDSTTMDPKVHIALKEGSLTVEKYLYYVKYKIPENEKKYYEDLKNLKIVGLVNDNLKGGFGAIAIQDSEGNVSLSYRGTDMGLGGKYTMEDMIDNGITAFLGESQQSKDAQAFYDQIIKKYPDSGLYLYGHSKGGELAARILVNNQENPKIILAAFFNPQPINEYYITGDISVLKTDRAIAYRNEHDLVSHIGNKDYYNSYYVKSNFEPDDNKNFPMRIIDSIVNEHLTSTFSYDEYGNFVLIDYDINENPIYSGYKNISTLTTRLQSIINDFQQSSTFTKVVVGGLAVAIIIPVIVLALSNPITTAKILIIALTSFLGTAMSGHLKKEIQELVASIGNYFNNLYRKVTNKGAKAIKTSHIIVDLNKLDEVKEKLLIVQRKISQADSDLNLLNSVEHLSEIKPLLVANAILPSKRKVHKCINYL